MRGVRFSIGMFRALIISFSILHFALVVPLVSAQETTWVTVEGTGSMERTTKEAARSSAIKDAERKAIEEVVASSVSSETLIVNLRLSGGLTTAIPYGKIVDKKILEESVVNVNREGKTGTSQMYRVKMKAAVIEEVEGTDGSFMIESSLNRTDFKDGGDMVIKIRPTNDCYIAVFIIDEDDRIIRLIPNKFREKNFLKAKETFIFPDKIDRRKGITLIAHVPEKKDAVLESVYVLALKQPIKFDTNRFQEGIFGVYNGQTALMNDLIKEIIYIPLNQRAEQLIQYQIRR